MPVASQASRGALVVAGLAAMAALALPRPVLPPFVPIGDHAVYTAASPRALALVEPIIHAPWFGAAPAPLAATVAAFATAALWMALRVSGAAPVAAAIVVAAWWSRPELRMAMGTGADAVAAAGAWWAAAVLMVAGHGGRGALSAAPLVVVAVASWPPMIVTAPALIALAFARRPRLAPIVLAAVAAGGAAGLALWTARAAASSLEPVGVGDVLSAVAWSEPRGSDPFVWPRITGALLPGLLAVMGAGIAVAPRPRRDAAALVLGAALTLCAPWLWPAWQDEIRRAVLWSAWPLVGIGLSWLAAQARRPVWVLTVMGGVLVGEGVSASLRDVDDQDRRAFGAALGARLAEVAGRDTIAVVAEDTRADTAVVAWGGGKVRRVRPIASRVDEARSGGAPVLVGPWGRTALELWGLRVRGRSAVTSPAFYPLGEVTGRMRCVPVANPWRELPGVEFTGRLGVHVPPGSGRFEAVVVGPPPLDVRLTRVDGRAVGRLEALRLDLTTLPPVLWPGDVRQPDRALVGTRVEVTATADEGQALALALGRRAPQVAVRFVEPAHLTGIATVCAAPLPRDDVASYDGGAVALDDPAFFAGGWHAVERGPSGSFRWTADRSVTLLPSTAARAVTLALTARAAVPGATLRLTVNEWPAGERPLTGAPSELTWDVPAAVWVDGTNEIVFDVSPTARPADAGGTDSRRLGAAVTSIRVLARE